MVGKGWNSGAESRGWEKKQLMQLPIFGASIYWKIAPSMRHRAILSHRGTGQDVTGDGGRMDKGTAGRLTACPACRGACSCLCSRDGGKIKTVVPFLFLILPFLQYFCNILFCFVPLAVYSSCTKTSRLFCAIRQIYFVCFLPALFVTLNKTSRLFCAYSPRQASRPAWSKHTFFIIYIWTHFPAARVWGACNPFPLPYNSNRTVKRPPPHGARQSRQAQAEQKAQAPHKRRQAPRGRKG